MDRLRFGIGIFILIVVLGSCTTSNQITRLPASSLPVAAPGSEQGQASTDSTPNAEGDVTNPAPIEREGPEISLGAPEQRSTVQSRSETAAVASIPVPTPPPQTSAPAPSPRAEEDGSLPTEPLVVPEPQARPLEAETQTRGLSTPGQDDATSPPAAEPAPPVVERTRLPTAASPSARDDTTTGEATTFASQNQTPPDPESPAAARRSPVPLVSEPEPATPAARTRATPTATEPETTVATPDRARSSSQTVSGPLDELVVELPGEGWIYIGAEEGSESVRLSRKRSIGGNTNFTFEMNAPGEYSLWFQRQDTSAGTFENKAVSVIATEGAVAPGRTAETPRAISEQGADSPAPVSADTLGIDYAVPLQLIADDDLTGGIRLLLDLSEAHDPLLTHLDDEHIERLVGRSSELPADLQLEFLEHVAESESNEAPIARSALLDVSIAREDPEAALAASNGLIRAGEAQPEQLLDVANLVSDAGNSEAAIGLALTALGEDVSPEVLARHLDDEALFLHARRLEQLGPARDLRKAIEFYEAIVRDYPLSSSWEQSRERVTHLRRHYFDVR